MFTEGEIEPWVGNKVCIVVLVVETYYLSLFIRLELKLNNCYFLLLVSRNLISVSVLDNKGYHFHITNGILSFGLNRIYYVVVFLKNGL